MTRLRLRLSSIDSIEADESLMRASLFRTLEQDWNVLAEARDNGRDSDADFNPSIGQLSHRFEPRVRRRRKRLDGAGSLIIRERNREIDGDRRLARKFRQQVYVPAYERGLGDNADGITKLKADFQTAARQLVMRFERNIRV